MRLLMACTAAVATLVVACGEESPVEAPAVEAPAENPFLAAPGDGKSDTAYANPDGVEVEVDLEADVEAPSWSIGRAPAELGQFAVTYLRKRGDFYLESLAEHVASRDRVEWLVDGAWIPASEAAGLDATKLTHFRIRGVNAVLLHTAGRAAELGAEFTATVPLKPYSVMSDAGQSCADHDGHITLSQSVYWYMWNPSRSDCSIPLQDMKIGSWYSS